MDPESMVATGSRLKIALVCLAVFLFLLAFARVPSEDETAWLMEFIKGQPHQILPP